MFDFIWFLYQIWFLFFLLLFFCTILLIIPFFNSNPQHLILFYIYIKFDHHTFNCFFFEPFLLIFSQFHPLAFYWLRVLLRDFFYSAFYKVILTSCPRSQIWKVGRSWLMFFYVLSCNWFFFSILSLNIEFLSRSHVYDFFTFIFKRLSQSHVWGHELGGLT